MNKTNSSIVADDGGTHRTTNSGCTAIFCRGGLRFGYLFVLLSFFVILQ